MRPLEGSCGIHPLARRHLPELQALASDAKVAATTRVPHPYPPDGAEQYFAHVEALRAAGEACVLAIEHEGRLVGLVGMHEIAGNTGGFGFWIGVPFWGRGYASFAARRGVAFAFEQLRLASLWAESLATNRAAHRVLQKAGFVGDGSREHGNPKWPADEPLLHFTLTATAWRASLDC